jgi:hypothetical protein
MMEYWASWLRQTTVVLLRAASIVGKMLTPR